MGKYVNIAGILLVMIGTVLSLWTIITTRIDIVGTAGYLDTSSEQFKKEKNFVIAGCILIVVGSISQIISCLI